jgi:hypothetical protein
MNIRLVLSNIGWDGFFWFFCAFVAFSLGVLDFLPQLQLTKDPILRLTLSGIGILLAAVVAQTTQRRAEISELKNALGVAEAQLLDNSVEVPQHLVASVLTAERFVLDTRLSSSFPSLPTAYLSLPGVYGEYHRLLYKRVSEGKLYFHQVEIIFHRYGLQSTIFRLLLYEGHRYYLRHYEPPPKAIPIMHMLSFDGNIYYLGGFYHAAGEVAGPAQRLRIREPNVAKLFRDYWDALWNGGISLHDGKEIKWEELKRIGLRVGVSEDEFQKMVSKLRDEVRREKRRHRLK